MTDTTLTPIAHNDHPLRHWDRTCPACRMEELKRSLAAAQAALRLVLDYPGVTEHVGSIITDIAQEALAPQEGERDD
jgi:hypothetical protein